MATYRRTSPVEIRERLQRRSEQLESVRALEEYQKYIEQQKAIEQRAVEQSPVRQDEEKPGVIKRALDTYGNLGLNVWTGLGKGLEGGVDFAIGLVGAVGGLFSSDFKEDVKEVVAHDFVGETLGANDALAEKHDSAWTKGTIVEDIAQGVGQMLPAVAVTIATSGAGAPTLVTTIASMGATAANAAGNATEQAYNDGADYYEGLGYGVARGATEAVTEQIGGYTLGKATSLIGKKIAGTALGRATSKGVGKLAYNFLSEGAEEVLSDALDPATKSIYKGKEAFNEYKDPDFYKNLGRTFVVGGSVGSIMEGGQTFMQNSQNKSRGGAQATHADEMLSHISEVAKNYGKSESANARYDAEISASIKDVSDNLKKMTESQRGKYLESIQGTPYRLMFDDAGNIAARQVEGYNADAMSVSLKQVSGNLKHAPAQAEISESAMKVKDALEDIFGDRAHVVISDSMDVSEDGTKGTRAFLDPETGVFYVNNKFKFDEKFTELATAIHELYHAAEGTKQSAELHRALSEFVQAFPEVSDQLTGGVEGIKANAFENYRDEKLNAMQQGYVNATEIDADILGKLLGSEEYVAKLAVRNENLVKKLYTYLKAAGKSTQSKQVRRALDKLTKKFGNALDHAKGGVLVSQIGDEEKKENTPEGVNERKSIVILDNGNTYVTADRKVIMSQTVSDMRRDITNFFDSLLENKKSLDIPTIEGEVLTITKAETADKARDNYKEINGKPVRMTDSEYAVKARAEAHIDELAEIAGKEKGNRTPDAKNHPFAKDGFSYRTVYFEDFDGSYYRIRLSVGHNGSVATVYNVGKITKDISPSAKIIAVVGSNAPVGNVFNNTIPQSKSVVNSNSTQNSKKDASNSKKSSSGINDRKSIAQNKQRQFEIIQKTNPMWDDYHVGIRTAEDIRTWAEVLELNDESEGQFVWGDFSRADAEQALKDGTITVYSSYPIKNGVFVSTSYVQAQEYAGGRNGKVYSKTIPLTDVAWINGDEGQYASVEDINIRYSFNTSKTGVANDALSTYSEELSQLILQKGDYIIDSFAKLEEIVNLAFDNTAEKATAYFGIINSQILEKIKNSIPNLPKEIEGMLFKEGREYSIATTLDAIRHIVDDKSLSREDVIDYLDRFADTILEFDSVSFDYYTDSYKNKIPGLLFKKQYPDGTLISFNLVSKKKRSVILQSLYMDKANYQKKKLAKTLLMKNNLSHTPKARVGQTSNNSIPQKSDLSTEKSKINDRSSKIGKDTIEMSKGIDSNSKKVYNNVYTEYQYNSFGWVRANDILTSDQYKDFTQKFAQIKNGKNKNYVKSASGSYIIAIGGTNDGYGFGIDNVLVYATGTIAYPKVEKIVKIDLYTEDDINIVRSFIYAKERNKNAQASYLAEDQYGEELVSNIRREDLPDYQRYQSEARARRSGGEGGGAYKSYITKQDGERDSGEAQADRSINERSSKTSKNTSEGFPKSEESVSHEKMSWEERNKDAFENKNFEYVVVWDVVKGSGMQHTKKIIKGVLDDVNEKVFIEKYADVYGKSADAAQEAFRNALKPDAGMDLKEKASAHVAQMTVRGYFIENILAQDEATLKELTALRGAFHKFTVEDPSALSDTEKARWISDKGEVDLETVRKELRESGISLRGKTALQMIKELDGRYEGVIKTLKESVDDFYDSLPKAQKDIVSNLEASVADEMLNETFYYERKKWNAYVVKKYSAKLKELRQKNKDILIGKNLEGNIVKLANDIANLKKGKYQNATQFQNDALKTFLSGIGKITVRGNINRTSARDIVLDIDTFYRKDNKMLEGFFDEGISTLINDFAKTRDSKAPLSVDELRAVRKILTHVKFVVSNYSRIWRQGQYVDARDQVSRFMDVAKDAKKCYNGVAGLLMKDKVKMFMDPASVFALADGYNESGFFTEMYNDLVDGLIEQQKAKKDLLAEYDAFVNDKANKKYINDLLSGKDLFTLVDKKIPKKIAIALYMTSKTSDGMETIRDTGWKYPDGNGNYIEMPPIPVDNLDFIYKDFSEQDKKLISILEDGYRKSGKLKEAIDMIRLGMSNVMDGYYYPLWRAVAKNFDSEVHRELERVSNLGFNKSRVASRTVLIIDSVTETFERHASAISKYYGLSIPVANFNVLYNMDAFGSSHIDYSADFEANLAKSIHARNPESLKSLYGTFMGKIDKYVEKLLKDIQGIKESDDANRMMGKIRSKYATFQLGLNPKVWFTQTSSYLASLSILSPASLIKGFTVKVGKKTGESDAKWFERAGSEVDKYCTLAELRDYEGSVVKAMAVTEKSASWTMKGIGVADRMIVIGLFGSCQAEAKARYGLEIGTEDNKKKAGELLKEVILKTQQNSLQTEWSEAMRSNSEIVKSFTMFGADSMKMISRVIDTIGRICYIKKRMQLAKEAGDAELLKKLQDDYKKAGAQSARQVGTMVSVAMWSVIIAELFRFFYNKKEEDDKSFVERFVPEVGVNMLGMVPVVRDVVSFFSDGFEINNYAYSMLNDLLDTTKGVYALASSTITGEPVTSDEYARAIRKMFYAAGQLTGLPTRNVYNFATGMLRRFDEGTAYKWDSLFYNASYKKDLAKALKDGNENLAVSITEMLLAGTGDYSSKTAETLAKLYGLEFDCLPRQVSDSATIQGVTYKLDTKQYSMLKKIYGGANDEVEAIISSKEFNTVSAEIQAKAIKSVYDTYYQKGLSEALGVEVDNKMLLFSQAFEISELALIIARCRAIAGDVDADGKTISGSKKTKVAAYIESLRLTAAQKYMIMGYLGYKNNKGEAIVRKYIQSLRLTKEQKEKLFEESGY